MSLAEDARFAREIAERAGRLLHERYERVETIDYKSAKDVVTEVDHLSEEMVLGALRERFPTDGILAEESGAHHGATSSVTDAAGATARALASGRTWIVDPLDGTINYANGIPFFCVSVALVVDGTPAVGVVVDPMRGDTFWATADGPAMLGEREIHASRKADIGDWVISLALGGRALATRSKAVRGAVRASRNTGSAALALAYVGNGRYDAFIQSAGMSAWDIAAAGLIAERAGARVTDPAGGPWFDVDKATATVGLVAAPPSHHERLLRLSHPR